MNLSSSFKFKNQTIYYSSAENMQELSDLSIDAIITSPPYNVGKNYSANGKNYDDRKEYANYLAFLTEVFNECYRVASERCVFFLNIDDSAKSQGKSEDVVRCAVKAGFRRLQTIVWVKSLFGKGHYTPSGRNRRLNHLWENLFILTKSQDYQIDPKSIGIPYSDKSNIGRYSDIDLRDAGDIWFIPYSKTTGATTKKGHEAPYPIELPYKCLQLLPKIKNVLDPFVGTGSTLRAAMELGIDGYGYEILPREEVIVQRMKEPIHFLANPLIPQMEIYQSFITDLINKCLPYIPKDDLQTLLASFKTKEIRNFIWACGDLKKFPLILGKLESNEKLKPMIEKISELDKS